ncbi:hypothetical protein BKA67DRAFT_657480 [Truncatella angustata]|uniref:LysM domain-containing protein n=1 Tax=Truncatella angustata TaxID=152316 RepID=A0A9P8UNP6_9PEZI|nr:uncharacterized protein BKA67DRAFT_657480 [Truncatella angustata]KAH6655548.1 hypothetical protein BKA67DRAFT_657480 [Truncatella angustata]
MASWFIINFALAALCHYAHVGATYLHNQPYQRDHMNLHRTIFSRQEDGSEPTALFLADNLLMFSAGCASALAATINCTESIREEEFLYTWGGMSADELAALCTDSCRDSIVDHRANVAQECADDIYVDPPEKNITDYVYGTSTTNDVYGMEGKTVNPLALVDYYFLNYNLLCLKDITGDFCYLSTANGTNGTVDDCGPCELDAFRLQMEDERAYDAGLAEQYSSAVSSCGITAAPLATPTSSFQNNNITLSENITFSCTGTYVPVETGTTCDQFAEANSMSTDQLLNINNLAGGCADWPGDQTELCVQDKCTPYTVQEGDTCVSVSNVAQITVVQLVTWNPSIDPLCMNWNSKVGHVICLSSPFGYVFPNETINDDSGYAPITTAAPVPTDAMTESNHYCGTWYLVQKDEYCQLIATKNGITLSDFYFLNPEIDSNCTNLWADASYCVAPVGTITTYDGYYGSSTASNTGTPTTLNTATLSTVSAATYAAPTATGFPLANLSIASCYAVFQNSYGSIYCEAVTKMYSVALADFLRWNPSILNGADYDAETCVLQNATAYCASYYNTSLAATTTSASWAVITAPANAAPSSTTDCVDWYTTQLYDTCTTVLQMNDIPFSLFYEWNPAIGSNCENLWLNTSYCVAGPGWDDEDAHYYTGTDAGTATSTGTVTSTSGPPGPTQTGITADCNKWYVAQAGDGCYDIAADNGITLDQFYSWNPAVGSNCENLWPDEAYCIGVSSSSSTTTTPTSTTTPSTTTSATQTSVTPPGPTQSGIPANCNLYAVATGGGCYDFAAANNITLDQLYEWNPVLNNDCENFWAEEAYCVGVSG